MNRAQTLLLLNLGVAFYSVGQAWLVQVTCYPLWAYVDAAHFPAYHTFWWHIQTASDAAQIERLVSLLSEQTIGWIKR